ncbi:Zn-dependent exopeptidase [Trichoderma longibrachiatum ATCC 18648]|uniref:Inactive metallocarboxypeptidase ECM14 n=1 Tax=Trichoderma longibrachiatum ATCC 18648 TaxID=983965 RepID=A0A2T4BTD3_TRILO|nr:Zn-dependent exopeptidase [Trichoderma longibrachiatum ATCC 18648]
MPSPGGGSGSGSVFPVLTRLRDAAIELVFGRHPSKAAPTAPSFSPARYANQLVLRFNVTTADEEAALAEAAAQLLLDIWAFTDEYVDIRLAASQVAPLRSLLPRSLHHSQSILIPNLATDHQNLLLQQLLGADEVVAGAVGQTSVPRQEPSTVPGHVSARTSGGHCPMITKFLSHFDIVFIPVVNPDGVEYTWQVDRLWRKNRQPTKMQFCRGMDLDHAFGFGWDHAEASSEPCSESYGGEAPFQAFEASELARWAKNETQHNVKFVGLVDLHSYSQQVLFPYSYTCDTEPPNLENLEELAMGMAKAIRLSNGESYSVTSACEGAVAVKDSPDRHPVWPRIESGGGSAIDWFYHELGAHYSYQIKLRDTGSYGFLLPKEYIVPTGEEMFDAMKYYGDFLLGNNGIEKSVREQMEHVTSLAFDDTQETFTELRRRRLRR